MNIQIMVFIYIYICVCVSLFDFLFINYTKHSKRTQSRMVRKLPALLVPCDNPRRAKKIYWKLRSANCLIAFHELMIGEETKELVEQWALRNSDILVRLTKFYCHSASENRAFWAYLLSLTDLADICAQGDEEARNVSEIMEQMLRLTNDASVYVRANAFKAVLRAQNWQRISEVIFILNRHPDRQSEKLITDTLLSFQGNHPLLARNIWQNFSKLDSTLQRSFINYMRLLEDGQIPQDEYKPAFAALLESRSTDREVRLALIRYFRNYPYEAVYPLLVRFVSSQNELMWRYAAVSATALTAYPCEQTLQVLKDAVSSSNWYLRFNAAESLLALGVDSKCLEESDDRYAREMLMFREQVRQQRVEAWL